MKSATSMLSIKAIPGAFHWMLVEMARWFHEMLGSTRSWYFTFLSALPWLGSLEILFSATLKYWLLNSFASPTVHTPWWPEFSAFICNENPSAAPSFHHLWYFEQDLNLCLHQRIAHLPKGVGSHQGNSLVFVKAKFWDRKDPMKFRLQTLKTRTSYDVNVFPVPVAKKSMTPSWSRVLPGNPTSSVVSGEVLQSFNKEHVDVRWYGRTNKKEDKLIFTHLATPFENQTRIWDCTVVRITIFIGVRDSLVNSSNTSQCPEICPVLQNIWSLKQLW